MNKAGPKIAGDVLSSIKNYQTNEPPVMNCPDCKVALEERSGSEGVRACPLCGKTDEEILVIEIPEPDP